MFEFFTLAIAVMALIFARKALNQVDLLRARLDAFEAATPPAVADIGLTAPASAETEIPIAPGAADDVGAEAGGTWAMADQPLPADPEPTAQPGPGFEERVGTRWVVWIGGLTLALGGFFLVRYSIEQGLLGPGVRVLLGALFALALLAAGEWTRRKEDVGAIAPLPVPNIPAILTAAGTAVAFATVYAAYALYGFLVPGTAFILMGLVALGTLAAALLHGPALAGLGIVAAFATPVLVSSETPDYWALYLYLAVVTAAAFALARIRLWRWLAVTTIVLATLWTLPCLDCGPSMIGPHAFHVIAGFILAVMLVVCGFMFGPEAERGRIEPISSAALSAYLFGATLIVLNSFHADAAIIVFALLVAGSLLVAWRTEAAAGAIGAAAGLVFIVFGEWAVRANPDMLVLPGAPLPGIAPTAIEGSLTLHLVAAAIFALGFGAAGFAAQSRALPAKIAVLWSAAAVFTPLALLVALYARIAHLDRSIPFAIVAVVLAAAFGAATEALSKREQERPGLPVSIALFATGALAALALALTFALEKGWLTIALALTSLGTAWISLRRPIPFLRWLAAILAAIVAARIGYEPRIAGDAVGTTPIFNWLLWGYGVPALSFWVAGSFLRRRGDDAPLAMVEAAAILFTVLLAFLEIRHAVYNGDISGATSFVEIALEVCTALAMAIGLERLRLRTGSIIHNAAAKLLTAFAGLASVFGLMLLETPIFWPTDVGGVFFNLLLLGYAMPAVLALLLSYTVEGRRRPAYANTIAAFALILALTYVSFEIRRLYHGPILSRGPTTGAEQYTYSIAWLAFGVILLGAGILFNSQRARLASAIVIALTIAKVFVIDISTLSDVYRALSFICLGLVLLPIGWLYQRILFRRPALPSVPEAAAST
jgi:uncharacterized membrane protein